MDLTAETDPKPDGPANRTRCRALTLGDVMIVLVGVALALVMGAHLVPLLADMVMRFGHEAITILRRVPGNWPAFWSATQFYVINTISYSVQIIMGILAGMTPVFLIIRLKRPRPSWRELFCQPGMVAGLAMVFGLFWGTGFLIIVLPNRFNGFTAAPVAIGGTVALSWALLALTRKWKAEPGWIDRLGCCLGCAAIAIAMLAPLSFYL